MKKPGPKTLTKLKRHYRLLVEHSSDPIVRRVAQAMEHALIFATEETSGWSSGMKTEPIAYADIIRSELRAGQKGGGA